MVKKRHTASVVFVDTTMKRIYLGITNTHWHTTKGVMEIETIGGALESGESPKEAAFREVYEEIGIDLNDENDEWKLSRRSFYMMTEGHKDTLFVVYVNRKGFKKLRKQARKAFSVRKTEDMMALSGICSIDSKRFVSYAGSEFGRKKHAVFHAKDIGGKHPVSRDIRRENLPLLRSFAIWLQNRIESIENKDSDEGESLFSFGSLM